MAIKNILRYVAAFSFLCTTMLASGQDNHFIYVQADNDQPFYIRMDGRVFSSTASGYIILPKLKDSTYEVNVGFPKNEFPEEEFRLALNGSNQGYLLKNLDNAWSLLNIETMALVSGVGSASTKPEAVAAQPAAEVQQDAFSSLLADVIKDSSILKVNNPVATTEKPAVKEEPSAKADVAENIAPKADSVRLVTTAPREEVAVAADAEKSVAPSDTAGKKPGSFSRILMVNEAGGQDMVYVNQKSGDTVRLFMPAPEGSKEQPKEQAKIIYNPEPKAGDELTITPTIIAAPAKEAKSPSHKKEEKPEPVAQIIYQPEEKAADVVKEDTLYRRTVTLPVNSDCNAVAEEKDFLRLRKRMAGERDNQKMVDAARKFFKSKCYTVEQVRNLSYLFMDDEGRYQFFDAAYPYTSDSDQFYTLEKQLKDPYYINRFKAMLHK